LLNEGHAFGAEGVNLGLLAMVAVQNCATCASREEQNDATEGEQALGRLWFETHGSSLNEDGL
jgi:hypothetical protein